MKKSLKELQTEATKLGIAFDGRWGKKKLQERINKNLLDVSFEQAILPFDEAEKEAATPFDAIDAIEDHVVEKKRLKIKNISHNKYEILDFSIKSLEVVELSDGQMDNTDLMRRINRHIEIKKFKIIE